MRCIECGDQLLDERAQLGYRYCTKESCQARHHRGLKVTAIGGNKGGDSFVVADDEELRERAESGEFRKKDSGIGLRYRTTGLQPAAAPPRRPVVQRPLSAATRAPAWSSAQEKIVRLYNDMGLSPEQIVERARGNVPRLGITTRLVVTILSTPRGAETPRDSSRVRDRKRSPTLASPGRARRRLC